MRLLTSIYAKRFLIAAIFFTLAHPCFPSPRIISQPQDQLSVVPGSTVVFQVEATTASPPLRFQWRLNGVNLPGVGTQLGTLLISNVQPESSGSYSVLVADAVGVSNSVTARLKVNVPGVPILTNDNFSNSARLVPAAGGMVRSENYNATVESNEPKNSGRNGGKSVWFTWTAPEDGVATFSTAGSSFDTLMDAFEPKNGKSDLKHIVSVDPDLDADDYGGFLTSKLVFTARGGTDYFIKVDGFGGTGGDIVLGWTFDPTTTDDLPAVAFRPLSQTVAYGSNLNFSFALLQFVLAESRWIFNGRDTGVTNSGLGNIRIDDSTVGSYSVQFTTLHGHRLVLTPAEIQISSLGGGAVDPNARAYDKLNDSALPANVQTLALASDPTPGPTLESGPVLEAGLSRGYSSSQIFSTMLSTTDPGEPQPCGVIGGASSWFSYQAPADGLLSVDTWGSSFDTALAIYVGDASSYSTLTNIACDNSVSPGNGGDRIRLRVSAGSVYYIQVDGVDGARGVVHLNINLGERPVIGVQPAGRVVRAGSGFTLSAGVSAGTTNLFYTWTCNGTNLPNATNANFTVGTAQVGNSGVYSVVISNLVDCIQSSNAVVTVLTAPQFLPNSSNQTVNAGANVSIPIPIAGDDLAYLWKQGGVTVGTNAALTILNVQPRHAGTYSLLVTNAVGSVSNGSAINLTVRYGPSISVHPVARSVGLGNNVSLAVVASAFPPPTFQWRFNGARIGNATNSTFTITNFLPVHEGVYAAEVSNPLGAVLSSGAGLFSNARPRIGSVGRSNGVFNMQMIGVANSNYVFQRSTDLKTWNSVRTNSDSSGLLNFSEPALTNTGQVFFRVVPIR